MNKTLNTINAFLLLCVILLTNSCGGGGSQFNTEQNITSPIITLSRVPGNTNDTYYGQTIVFSQDGKSLAIGEHLRDLPDQYRAGSVYIYTKLRNGWTRKQLIISETPISTGSFGRSVAFSNDGTTLAIGEPISGTVYLYSKLNGQWKFSNTLKSSNRWANLQSPTYQYSFGSSLAFSPDSSTLVVGDNTGVTEITASGAGGGSVEVFIKSGSAWIFSQLLNSDYPSGGNLFGETVIFSPDGNTLAVSEPQGDIPYLGATDVGTLQIFSKTNGRWNSLQLLYSPTPKTKNLFSGNSIHSGNQVDFSPDSTMLAVVEYAPLGIGAVQMFTKINSTKWYHTQTISPKFLKIEQEFGNSVSFSADGKTLAVGEPINRVLTPKLGAIHLFSYNATNWTHSQTIHDPTIDLTAFGRNVVFSPINNTLVVRRVNTVLLFDVLQ